MMIQVLEIALERLEIYLEQEHQQFLMINLQKTAGIMTLTMHHPVNPPGGLLVINAM